MATYSLLVFGGRDGVAVTIGNNGSGKIRVTLTNHGLRDGHKVRFTYSSAPGNITTGTTYYAKVIASGTFDLYSDSGLTTAINYSSAGTSVKVLSEFWDNFDSVGNGWAYGVDKTRYGTAGSERVYASLSAMHTARAAAAVSTDIEVCEVALNWYDIHTSGVIFNVPCASFTIAPEINGTKTAAWHGGTYGSGYFLDTSGSGVLLLSLGNISPTVGSNTTFRDMTIRHQGGGGGVAVAVCGFNNRLERCYVVGSNNSSNNCGGIYVQGTGARVLDNIALRFRGSTSSTSYGIQYWQYASDGIVVAGNVSIDNTVGMQRSGTNPPGLGKVLNNLCVGNATNWGTAPAGSNVTGGYNGGESGNTPWGSTGNITNLTTSDFTTYNSAGNSYDLTPSSTAAHQVDTGVFVPEQSTTDYKGNERPWYNNGGAETVDMGPIERDLGYTRPVQRDLVFTGAVTGSQIIVYTTGTTTELQRNNSTSGDETYHAGATGVVVDYTIYKIGYDPIRVTGVSLTATTTTITVQQTKNRAWVASSGLTYGTDLTFTAGTPNILKARIASPLQNYLCLLYEAFINSATNTSLRNIDFPVLTNGPNSFSLIGTEWRGWSTTGTATSNTSLDLLSRDGMRYLSSDGATVNAVWGAFYTPDTPGTVRVKYKQSSGGSPVNALATSGPIDQLIQLYGNASYGNFDYTGFMEMRAPKPGYSQPKPDFVATYGTLEDQLYPIGLAPTLQYATTDADIDAAHLVLNNGAKTYVVSASHSVAELYQRAQWWANQDAQWSADIPLTSTDGNRFTLATGWTLSGLSYVTGSQTFVGGTCVLDGPGTYAPGFDGNTVQAQGEGTYTFTAAGVTLEVAPTADNVHYVLGDCTLSGTLTVHNTTAHPCVVEVPAGTTTSSTGNTGGAITFSAPQTYQTVTVSGFVAGSGLQIYDLKYAFTVSGVSVTPTAGATYTHNGVTYTVVSTSITAGSGTITVRASVDPQTSGTLTKSGGTGDSSITFSAWDFAGTQLFNGTASSGDTVISGSTAVWTDSTPAAAPRVIRLRVSYQSGASAKNFIDTVIGTCATSGSGKDVSYLVSQTDDASYNTSAIDGSAVTGITITTASGKRVNISLTGGGKRSHQQVYAYQVYWQHTDTGRAQETAFIESYNAAHFTYTDFRFTNPNSGPSNAVTVYNGYAVDSVTGLPETLIADDTPGIVNIVGTESVLVTTGSGPLTVGQAAELASAASSSSTAATESSLARKLTSNKRVLDPATGIETVYDDDGAELYTRQVYIDTAGSQSYDGQHAPHRVEKYA